MDDKEVQVQFKAVVGDLQGGLKEAADSVRESTTGMAGDVGGLADTIRNMGSSAAVLAGVGVAFEALRRAAEWVQEAVKDTNELADSFEKLGYATGASLEQLNVYTVAMKLSGDQASSLEGLIVGQQRAIRANSETLIANGVAADQATLMSMSFEDYLRRVQEIAENMATPTDRAQFLIAALGRSGAMAGNQLKEFVENLAEAKRLTQDGGIITQQSIDQLNEADRSVARLETAEQKYAAATAEKANKVANTWRDLKSSLLETGLAQETVNAFLRAGVLDVQSLAEKYHVSTADMLKDTDALLKEVHKLREGWIEVAKASMDHRPEGQHRPTTHYQPPPDKHLKTSDDVAAAKKAAEERARAAKEALAAQVQVELNMARDLEEERRNIEREAQKEREKGLREWNAKLEKQAHEEKRLEEEKNRAIRRAEEKLEAEREQAMRKQEAQYRQFFGSIASGFTSSVGRMITEGQTFGQFLKGTFSAVGDSIVQSLANMAAEWLTNLMVTKAMAKSTAASQITGNAGVAASAAMGSVAAIPFYGWAMAPEVGAETFALAMGYMGTIASAAQGFDIPAGVNPLTQLHEREMVLPAEHADTIRNLEGKGASPKIYISAVDARGVERVLRRNQGALIKLGNEAARNNRRRA